MLRSCRFVLLMAIMGWLFTAAEPVVQSVMAQEAAAPAEGAAAAPAGEGGAEAPRPKRNAFVWFLHSVGAIGGFIFLLSIYFIATVGKLFMEMKQEIAMPPEVVDQCEELLQARDFKNIYNLVKDDDSFFSRVLSTGISELPSGLAEARDSMERVGESVVVEMEKKISMLAVLGTLGPMIGLLGTLKGMIASFSVIALSGTTLDPAAVADGISEALLLTLLGVGLSVPAIYFYAVFRNRVSGISVATMLRADQFLRHFAHAARSKAPAGAAPAAKVAKA